MKPTVRALLDAIPDSIRVQHATLYGGSWVDPLAVVRPVPAPPILAVCPNPACRAGIDSPNLPSTCPRCGANLRTEEQA